ncbi:MAG: putative oxidoreductase YjmC [Chloroflexi bacterium]|nr:putative oxidoreductase YjmC [Chloroflexota bacterium]
MSQVSHHRNEHLSSSQLKRFCSVVLQKVEIPPTDADLIAESLVQANLWGVDSHGVTRMAIYVERLKRGLVNPRPRITILRETPAMAVVDGDNGSGQVVASRAMELAIAKARESGVGLVGIRNSNHFGATAFFTMMALRKEMIGVAMSNASATMAPWGGRSPYLGTNPLSVAVPAGQELPLVLDMATSVVARGKILLAAQQGESIPAGWAIDLDGEVTTDAARALDGCVLPFGGPKGSAIALLIDVLSGVLTGGVYGPHVGDLYRDMERPQCLGHMMGAIDIGWFSDVDVFKKRMDKMIRELKSLPPAKGVNEVLLPGEIEARIHQQREAEGIPLTPGVIADLRRLALEYAVPWCGAHQTSTEGRSFELA